MLSSEVFFIVIFPLSASTASLKVRTILAFVATSVALSDGLEDDKVGASLSKFVTTKFQFVLPEDVSVSVQLNFPFVTVTVPVEPAVNLLEETPVITEVYVPADKAESVLILKVVAVSYTHLRAHET